MAQMKLVAMGPAARNVTASPDVIYIQPTLRGLGEIQLTDALGVGALGLLVGSALGFALGAAITARAASRRW